MADTTKKTSNVEIALAVIQTDVSYIKKELDDIKELVKEKYVTKEEFEPIKKIVYGLVSLILLGVAGAILKIVIG